MSVLVSVSKATVVVNSGVGEIFKAVLAGAVGTGMRSMLETGPDVATSPPPSMVLSAIELGIVGRNCAIIKASVATQTIKITDPVTTLHL